MTATCDFELAIFAWVFLVLCWNLMARCVSVAGIMFTHISWANDALTVVFPTHKGDQEGNHASPKHVFANRQCPEICPILALAVFIFTIGFRREGSSPKLFSHKDNSESRFSLWVRTTLGECADDFVTMGDQMCGRAATGININSASFADLPAHFDLTRGPILSVEEWEEILPGYSTFYPETFRVVLPFLLAQIVYHRTWLKDTLAENHPFFNQRVWTSGIIDRLKLEDKVLAGVMTNEVSGLSATGVPPHIVLACDLADFRQEFRQKVGSMEENIGTAIDNLPEKLKQTILDNFQVDGAIPITSSQIHDMLNNFRDDMVRAIAANSEAQNRNRNDDGDRNPNLGGDMGGYRMWMWGGRLHPCPEDFEFPICNVKVLWDLWYSGRPCDNVQPYRFISTKCGDLSIKLMRGRFSKATFVMKELSHGHTAADIANLTINDRDKLFEDNFMRLFHLIYPEKTEEYLDNHRVGDLQYVTMYDLLKKYYKT